MAKQTSVQFNCFSPPVMLATLIIESLLAVYTMWRYRLDKVSRLVVLTLVSLATFQFAEYHVCTGYGFSAGEWSRLGFVAITTLPALGMHLLHSLADKPNRRLVGIAYATMVGFMVFFLVSKTAFIGYKCTGNYVIFQIGLKATVAYGLYYYGWLLSGIALGSHWANQFLKAGQKQHAKLQMVRGLIIGYLVFLVPTAVAYSVKPSARQGIPSVMCGFAVLFALILSLYVLPKVGTQRHRQQTA